MKVLNLFAVLNHPNLNSLIAKKNSSIMSYTRLKTHGKQIAET